MSEYNKATGESTTALLDEVVCHQRVADQVSHRFLAAPDVATTMNSLYSSQCQHDGDLMDKLREVGRCVEPIDPVTGVDPELPALKAYLSGSTVALEVLDTVIEEVQLDANEARRYWKEDTWFVRLIQPDNPETMAPAELYAAVGRGIVDRGKYELGRLPAVYKDLIERIDDTNVISFTHSNVFKASFGFVLSACLHAVNELLVEREMQTATSQELDWDAWLDNL